MNLSRVFSSLMAPLAIAMIVLAVPERAIAQRPLGIDVSSYQLGSINWSSVKGAGISFAWAKATEGTYDDDGDFVVNENNAKAAGVPIGPYDFDRPDLDSPTTEVNFFWSAAGNYIKADGLTLMPMLDFETFNGFTGATTYSDWANQWCNGVVANATAKGVKIRPTIYLSACKGTYLTAGSVNAWISDIADYNGEAAQSGTPWSTCSGDDPWGSSSWVLWQYTSTGNYSGIPVANVDHDVFNGTSAQMISTMVAISDGPIITKQPVSVAVPIGSNATFSVSTSSTGVTYQWAFKGTSLSGATKSSYTVSNVQTNNVGAYTVSLTASGVSTPSSAAMLSLQESWTNAPGSIVSPASMVNWWTADWSYYDIVGKVSAVPQGTYAFAPGEHNYAFKFDGSTTMLSTGLANLPVPWTFCLWVNRQNSPQTSAGLLEDGTYSLKLEQYNGTRKVGVSVLGVADSIFSSGYSVPLNTWTHLAFVGTSANTSLYVNGVLSGTVTNVIPLPREYIGAAYILSSPPHYVDFMLGSMDELMTFNTALSAAEISAIHSAGTAGLVRGPGIASESWLTSTHFMLNLVGLPGKTLTVAWSTNLTTWTNVTAPFSNPTGNFSLTDLGAKTPSRYYRVSQQ